MMSTLLALALLGSGLHGTVMRGPTTPVCRVGTPCSAPAAGTRLRFVRHGHVVARARVHRNGRYSVRLSPGVYSVRFAPHTRIGRGISPHRVRVLAEPRRLDFFIDTGLR
jgi:hypothetical protein